MKVLYLNEEIAEKLLVEKRGPTRALLNIVKSVLISSSLFPHLAFDPPKWPIDLFFFYSHAVRSLEYYRSNVVVDEPTRAAGVKRLIELSGAQKVLSSPASIRCRDFLIIFDVLLPTRLILQEQQLDIPWVYEVLSRALPNDNRLDYVLSRSMDFEDTPTSELAWEG